MSNSSDPDQARRIVGPDLGPNCLPRLSADDTGRQRVNWTSENVMSSAKTKISMDICQSQSELPRPIKIGLGCVCSVELCTKLQHSVSRKWRKKNSSVAHVVSPASIKIDNSGDPKNTVYVFS